MSTVSAPSGSATSAGKADSTVAPSRPLTRIVYKLGDTAT